MRGNVIRFLAPITIPDDVFTEALDTLEETLRETRAGMAMERAA